MKKTDIAMIILIASVSVLVAYFVARSIPVLGGGTAESVKVKQAELIQPTLENPSPTVFNKEAINPTIEVVIGGQSSTSGTP